MKRSKYSPFVVVGILSACLYIALTVRWHGREGAITRQGDVITWVDGDILGYKITYLNAEGIERVTAYWALPIDKVREVEAAVAKRVGIGGIGEFTASYDSYFPNGDATKSWPVGEDISARIEVLFRLPKSRAVESFASEGVFPLEVGLIAIDHTGSGYPDVIGGRPWQKKNSWYIDVESCRPISMNGGGKRLWEWIGPRSGYLLWRPGGWSEAEVTGWDIVGTGTGGQEWENAYQVVAQADLDKNGWVDGEELDVLDYWVDRNSNGEVEAGELTGASEVFQKISSQFSTDKFGARYNPRNGALLADGRFVGSWEFWPRGETHEGGYLSGKGGSAQPGKLELQNRGGETSAQMLVFNMCGGDERGARAALGKNGQATRTIALVPKGVEGGAEMRQWDWVGPCHGIVVLPGIDKAPASKISEYIYGNNTGGQPWRDSYEALRHLDGDRNGWVEGDELDKAAVWVDRSSDAKPDSWEIQPARDILSKISVWPHRGEDGTLGVSDEGVVFQNGKTSPSWCWESQRE
jgi:hypothetical protein